MLRSIRQMALFGFASLPCLPLLLPDQAQAYPDQPIKVIVTFPPGGDACGRQLDLLPGRRGAAGNVPKIGGVRLVRRNHVSQFYGPEAACLPYITERSATE